MKKFKFIALLVGVLLLVAACDSSEDEDSQNLSAFQNFDAEQVQLDESNQARTQRLDRVWERLTAAGCWDASFVTVPGIGGSVGSVSQYSFSDPSNYRYVGFETWAGRIRFHNTGTYADKDVIVLTTWTDDYEFLILFDDDNIIYFTRDPNGQSFSPVTYGAKNDTCL